ncbi:dihydrofolate reductase family protein [Asanoa sp. NPDC049573]|uniref:dihydrofolate reductase family protein n=1 Tax=Asanoa sp. NPDC049573 TaxID=3155396 RepID=UPI0034441A1E
MRKIIVSNIVSLDGYSAGAGGNVMALPMDAAFDAYNVERLRAAGTLLLGRDSYLGFLGYWPGIADAPDDRDNRALSADNREISRLDNAIGKVVVSDRLTADQTGVWRDTTTIVRRAGAAAAVRALKEQPGGDILVFGSRTMWNGLLADGLIDEIHLMVGAVVLGDGDPAFLHPPTGLRLTGIRTFPGSDNVVHVYAPA